MNDKIEPLVFELGAPGRQGVNLPLPEPGVPRPELSRLIPENLLRGEPPELPELSECDTVRHFTRLSQKNYGVDSGFYPLGSCTMKYNPKINEDAASLDGFRNIHPLQPAETMQGCLELMVKTASMLAEIAGMDAATLQPAAGAHGEMTGLMIIRAYHEHNGDTFRKTIIVPDTAHGTNPASAAAAGFTVRQVKSDENGNVDLAALREAMDGTVAGLMLTNPSTLGLFESSIAEIARIVHEAGGLLYYDGANLNGIIGVCRPGDMGFDAAHINLHKTFSAPHGGGGPGSGPVCVKKALEPFLPKPLAVFKDGKYSLDYDRPLSIGRVKSFYGNFSVIVRAYAYLRTLGPDGLREVSQSAVLNANYIREKLKTAYRLPYDRLCKHEVVFSGERQAKYGVSTLDIAKRLIDYGFHPPTVYFPLIVKEALMVEPTETESREQLDEFIEAMLRIAEETKKSPELLRGAPHDAPLTRLDEVGAARNPIVKYTKK